MKNYFKAFFFVLAAAVASLPMTTAWGAIELIGVGSIPGTATDSSGLTDPDRFGLPQNLLGAFGSAIAYTGVGNTYIATPDRGPNDGNSAYLDRYYKFNITVDPVAKTVTPTLLSTVLLTKLTNTLPLTLLNFTGNSSAFSPDNLRLDPEGVRMGYNRNIYISDEYGPYVYEFGQNGQILRSLNIPNKFQITAPNANGNTEISTNTVGRVANRGMEGLAITPDGTKLYGIMQSPLIQDTGRNGINNRLLMIDIATGNKKEFVYQLTKNSYGVSEILAINDHQFLVDERDGSGGTSAKFKKLFLIDPPAPPTSA